MSLISYENGVLAYQPTFLGSKIQDRVLTTNQLPLRRGYSAILKQFEYGQYIFNIEHKPFCGAVFCRAPGSIAKVIRHLETEVLLRLPSGTERWFNNNCIATLGSSALSLITLDRYLLAGYMRHLG